MTALPQEIENMLARARAGQLEQAELLLSESPADAHALGEGWYHLAEIAQKEGQYDVALRASTHAVSRAPENPLAHLALGLALTWLDRHQEACQSFLTAARLEPRIPLFWRNVGLSYQFMNKLDDAERAFTHFLEANGEQLIDTVSRTPPPESAYGIGYWDLALLDLLRGNLPRGFARFRARFKAVPWLSRPTLPRALWRGEDIKNKIILIHDEQGLGDCLMLARYLPLLKTKGARVRFVVHPPLVPLLQDWDDAFAVAPRDSTIPLDFAYYASIFDLPFVFGTTLDTIPASVPYLPTPAPDDDTQIEPTADLKVGIAWAGAPAHIYDAMRSLPLATFAPLFNTPNVTFYSFVKDLRPGDIARLAAAPNVQDLSPRLRDFGDTARFIGQMDLIITCDTSLAHLAGGMGKKVWTLLPFAPDWRWLLDRDDSPWYPQMRLFRQKTSGDWTSVIRRVQQALTGKE